MFEKETASKDLSENHLEDFKKCLKKRAIDHSQFYHRLSNAPIVAPKTQSKQNITDVIDNNIASKNMMFNHRFYEKNDHLKDNDCNNENLTEFELNEMKIINNENNNNDNNSNDDDDGDNENNNKIDNNRNLKNIDTNCNSNVGDYNDNNYKKYCEVDILNQKKLSENILKCLSNDSSKNCEKLKITNNEDVATASSVIVNSLDIKKCVFNEERNVMCNLLSNNDDNDVLKFLKNNEIHQVFLDDSDDNTMISNVETNQDCGYHQYLCHNVNKNNNKIEIISSIEINDDQTGKIKKNSSNEFDKNTIINNTVHTNTSAIDQSIKNVFNKQNVSTDNESNESSNFDNDIMLIRKVNIDNDNYFGDGSGDGGGVISENSNYMKSSGIIFNDDDNDNDNRQQPHDNNHNGGFKLKKSSNFNNNNNGSYNNKNENVKTYTLTTEGNIILASTSSNKNIVNTIEKYSNNNDEYECDENSESAKSMMLMAMANKKLNNYNNNNNNNKNDYNKNKMNEGEQWNDSNYFTFIPVGSFDDDRLDRTARWCCSRDIITERNSNNSSSSSSSNSRSANKNLESAAKEQHFERYLRDTVNSFANNIPEDQNIDEYNTFDFYNIDKYKAKSTIINYNKDYNIVNFNCIQKEPENRIKFPCVEKLVKMYTKLLQDKKTENNMEIKAEENETNIKLKCDDDSKKCKNQKKIRKSDSLKLKVTGDRSDLNRASPVSDEGCPVGQSPYSSDYDDNEPVMSKGIETETETETEIENIPNKDKVMRSSSSDSALGLDDECQGTERPASPPPPSANTGRRMTLTVADIPLRPTLLPLAEPTKLPDSPTNTDQHSSSTGTFLTQTAVPSKVLLEERVVEIPEDRFGSLSSSRRESAQSCFSDYNSEYGGVRYVRTPSVVVSDYSDDVMCGITLEEIEYFRAHRMRRRSSADTAATEKDDTASDVSAASSCSNLYYCGSTISALDGADCYVNGMRMPIIDRKISDCSTCSTASGEEDDDHYFTLPSDYSQQQHHNYQQDNSFAEQQQQQHQVEQQIQHKIRKHKKALICNIHSTTMATVV